MRDLDEKIAEWRTRMAAGGIKTPAVLDELENHLREDVERQVRAGRSEEDAFAVAVRHIGESDLLKAEFVKVAAAKPARWGKVLGIACCLVALPLPAFWTPAFLAIPELTTGERMLGTLASVLIFLSPVSWRFSHKFLPVIPDRSVRRATTIGCGLAGLTGLVIFGALLPSLIVPRVFGEFETASGGNFRGVFALGIVVLWAMAFTAIMGAVAYGLEEAANRRAKENAYV